jgi:hypothetical protein
MIRDKGPGQTGCPGIGKDETETFKELPPLNAPDNDMMKSASGIDSRFARHEANITASKPRYARNL